MTKLFTITWLTLHEALRRKMVLAGLVLGVLFILLYDIGLLFLLNEARSKAGDLGMIQSFTMTQVYSFLLTVGLYVVHFLTIMLAIFASVDAISGEIKSHTMQTLVTKPVRRWEVVLGKWLGYAVMILAYLALLGGGIFLSIYSVSGYVPPNVIPAMGLLALEALVLLSLSLLLGTRLSTLTNGVVLFMLYGLAFIGSWIEQFGSLLQSHSATNVGIVASLLMPVESLWSLAAYLLEPPLVHDLPSGLRVSPLLGIASVPSANMVIYAVAYAGVMLALAVRAFSRRDL
ncbi:MAG: ABC transporter permease subunit [Chloroflexia bacterium]